MRPVGFGFEIGTADIGLIQCLTVEIVSAHWRYAVCMANNTKASIDKIYPYPLSMAMVGLEAISIAIR